MPHGHCRQFFGRPEDKTFTRKIDECDFSGARNHSLLPGLVTMEYQQFVEYKYSSNVQKTINQRYIFFKDKTKKLMLTLFLPKRMNNSSFNRPSTKD